MIESMIKWLRTSDRARHLFYGWLISLLGSITAGVAAGITAEYKDKAWGGLFDYKDLIATIIGSVIGQLTQFGLVYMIYSLITK